MLGSSQERTGDTQGGVWDARERGFQHPLSRVLLVLFLPKQEKGRKRSIATLAIIHLSQVRRDGNGGAIAPQAEPE